ncbi:uncharacterized protein LOC106135993 isoform X1 [Amyelois transitella]|uniref:uncharacterized protein LOC106135993 isoform X1 n=1 Tax=Amyelois transitella TaxID=680683 RepID=UPI0029906B8E|nr:uncharacterized protein LOC106135993 isoform X1 [Amyelois transitella]
MDEEEKIEVKVEDEVGIFVEEEPVIIRASKDNHYDDNASENIEPLSSIIRNEAVIYTTKLDEMRVWEGIFDTPKNVLERIYRESKPIWTGRYKKRKRRKHMIKYMRFLLNLQRFHDKVSEYGKEGLSQNYSQEQQSVIAATYIDNSIVISSDDDSDPILLSASMCSKDKITVHKKNIDDTDTCTWQKHSLQSRHIIVILTLRSALYDVYFINKKRNITDFYTVDTQYFKSMGIPLKASMPIKTCCWYKRQEKMNKYAIFIKMSSTLLSFMRKTHDCDPKMCICCCKNKCSNNPIVVENQNNINKPAQERNLFQNKWHQRLSRNSTIQQPKNIINTALSYLPKRKTINKKQNSSDSYRKKYFKLQIEKSQTLVFSTATDGSLNSIIKLDYRPCVPIATDNIFDMICSFPKSTVYDTICCLDKGKKFFFDFFKQGQTAIANFFINFCNINTEKCINHEITENLSPTAKGTFFKIYLPKYPRHCKRYLISKIRPCSISQNQNTIKVKKLTSTLENPKSKCVVMPRPENSNEGKKVIPVLKNINDNECVNNSEVNNSAELIDLDVEDLNLVISPNGSVKIQTKSLPAHIATQDLKILREIVNFANQKILSLGTCFHSEINVDNLFKNNKPRTKKNLINPKINETRQGISANSQPPLLSVQQNKSTSTSPSRQINPNTLDVNTEVVEKNVYQSFTNIGADKRKQYSISYDFIKVADIDLWTKVKVSEKNEVLSRNQNENTKRKCSEKVSSQPSKQRRKVNLVEEVASTFGIFPVLPTPSTSGINSPIRVLEHTNVPTEILPMTSNTITDQLNVSAVPIIRLPLDKTNSFLPSFTSQLEIQPVQNPDAIIIKEEPLLTNNDLNVSTFLQVPHNTELVVDTLTMTPVKIEFIQDEKNDDCILGV